MKTEEGAHDALSHMVNLAQMAFARLEFFTNLLVSLAPIYLRAAKFLKGAALWHGVILVGWFVGSGGKVCF